MKLAEKGDKFVLSDVSMDELWVLYWALKTYAASGRSVLKAREMSEMIYSRKLQEVDPGYNEEVDKAQVQIRNQAILKQLQELRPISNAAGISPKGF